MPAPTEEEEPASHSGAQGSGGTTSSRPPGSKKVSSSPHRFLRPLIVWAQEGAHMVLLAFIPHMTSRDRTSRASKSQRSNGLRTSSGSARSIAAGRARKRS